MTIKIEGLDEVMRKIDSLGKPNALVRPMTRAVNHIWGKMKKDPAKAPGAFSRMATDGQRRAYWAKVSENPAIHGSHGYIRSHRLYKGWQKKVEAGGRRGIVENTVDEYADYVQGARQQPFHAASRYPRADKVAKDEAGFVVKIFEREYERLISK